MPDVPPQRSWPRRLVNRLEMDRATFYVAATRGWRLTAGMLTTVLIGLYFSKEVQGYYFAFWSLLEFQALVDLGISGVIIQSAAHEWSDLWLEDGAVAGPAHRRAHLSALARFFQRWFLRAAAIFAVAIAAFGLWFFHDGSTASKQTTWQAPWIALAVASGISLTMTPRIALLEGCGQYAAVHRMRLFQMMLGNLGVWTAILLNLNLWVTVVAAGIQVAGELALLLSFRRFFASLPDVPPEAVPRDWQQLVRPMQRRLGLQTAVKFFANNMLTPVILRYHGAAAAGPVGMTWNLLRSLQHAAFAWIQTRAPLFGEYVAHEQYEKLDRVFRRLTLISAGVMVTGVLSAGAVVAALPLMPGRIPAALATRMLDGWHTILIGATFTLYLASAAFGIYLAAHRRAPLVVVTVACNLLTAGAVWALGAAYGVTPAVWAMFLIALFLQLPATVFVWSQCRNEWHGGSKQTQPPA